MNIPLIVWHPKKIPAGQSSDALIGQYDIMPTILDHLGVNDIEIEGSPGKSFAKILRGQESTVQFRDAVYIESEETRGVRTDQYGLLEETSRHRNIRFV